MSGNPSNPTFDATIEVMLRSGVSDPQGATVEKAVHALGYAGVSEVKIGKSIHLKIEAPDETQARATLGEICDRLLANPVIETSDIALSGELSRNQA